MAILVYGSLVPDIVFMVPRLPLAGEDVPASSVSLKAAGGGGNVAMALAAWGYDVTSSGNSVGEDPLGRWAADRFTAAGITLPANFVMADGVTAPNGIIVTPDGERTILGSDYQRVTWLPVPEWENIAAVMVDGYSGTAGAAVIEGASDRGLPVIATDRVGPGTVGLTMLLWSASEHPDSGEALTHAVRGPFVAVTGGPDPIIVYTPDGSTIHLAVEAAEAPDSTGAGDVLAAGVVAGLSEGLSPLTSLERAADTATRYVAEGRDSPPPPPRMDA